MKTKKYGIGTVHTNRRGEKFIIIGKGIDDSHRIIQFQDSFQYIKEVNLSQIYLKTIVNPYYPSICGIGYLGELYNSSHFLYDTWRNMIHRCYNPNYRDYKFYGAKGVKMHEDWHCFSTFVDEILYEVKGGELLEQIRMGNYNGPMLTIDKDRSREKLYSKNTVVIMTIEDNNHEKIKKQ